jgi:hypothetical protein
MGKAPWGECPRCGFKRRLTRFRKEWTGLRVCPQCWDAKPPDIKPPRVRPEGVPLPNAQPETVPVFHKYTDGSHL